MSIIPVSISREKRIEFQIQSYADSLNSPLTQELPKFLFNPCLDLDRSLWIKLEPSVSIRQSVIERVTNKEALERIVNSGDKRLRAKGKGVEKEWRDIPYLKKSWLQLTKVKLKAMK